MLGGILAWRGAWKNRGRDEIVPTTMGFDLDIHDSWNDWVSRATFIMTSGLSFPCRQGSRLTVSSESKYPASLGTTRTDHRSDE
jgi:hypothetical protein